MHARLYFLSLLALALGGASTPLNLSETTAPPTPLSEVEINSYIPYAWFAAAAYCPQATQANWTCGSCRAPPIKDLVLYASGGDNSFVQNWYVGWWPSGNSIIVTHEGTSITLPPIVRDFDIPLVPIDPIRFPGAPPLTLVHQGFHDGHAITASKILAAVNQVIAEKGATKVTTVGHSLGGALALLEGLFLRLNLPSHIRVNTRTFGQLRVGNDVFARFVDTQVPDLARITIKGDVIPVLPSLVLGYRHTSGEKHKNEHDVYYNCPGRDNLDVNCSTGQILGGAVRPLDHVRSYPGGINIGPAGVSPSSLC